MDQADALRVQARWQEMLAESSPVTIKAAIPMFSFQNEKIVPCGSGFLLRISNRFFILTAAHVLDLHEIHGLPLFVGPSEQGGTVTVLDGAKYYRSPHSPDVDPKDHKHLRLKESDPVDMGIIELPEQTATSFLKFRRFATLQEVDVVHAYKKGAFLIAGYPYASSKVDTEKLTVESVGNWFMTELDDPAVRDDRLAMFLKYTPTGRSVKGEMHEMPDPYGMSGCGVWRICEMKPLKALESWTIDDVKAVGIEHSWISKDRRIQATPIGVPIMHIYQRYDDLRKVMDLHLGEVTREWL